MKKGSAMGGGEFEYSPDRLEIKISKRLDYIENCHTHIKQELDSICLDYQKQGLGSFDGIRKELLRRLVLEMG